MFTTPGEQEPRIRSDDAPTVKKRRSRKKLGLSSVSKAFSKSTLSSSLSTNLPSDQDIPSSARVTSSGSGDLPDHHDHSPRSSLLERGADRNAWRSVSNPALARAHTFDVESTRASSPVTGDEKIQEDYSAAFQPLASEVLGDGFEGRGAVHRRSKGRVVLTSAHLEVLKKNS